MRSILSSAASSQKLILARGRGREERKTEEPISALLAGTKEILLLIAFAVYYFGCRKPTQRMPGEYVSHNACASSSNFEQTMQMAPVAPQMGQPQMLPPHMAQPQMVSPQMVSPQMAPPQMAPPQMAPSQAGQPPPRFDPYTGQPIQPPPKFDPYTGQPILMVEAAPVVVP